MEETTGGAQLAPTFDGIIKSIPPISWTAYTKKRFVQECAMALFYNTNFKEDGSTNIFKAANNALSRANILADLISKQDGFVE